MNRLRVVLSILILGALVSALTACSAASNGQGENIGTGPSPSSSGSGPTASWAATTTRPGSLLTTVRGSDFTVDIYEVGTAKAAHDGQFTDPQTGKPIINTGDTIVYVNYVFHNTGKSVIDLGADLVGVEPRYNDWPYLQGMDSVSDAAQFNAMHVNSSAFGSSAGGIPFKWMPGTTFSFGQNFPYESGSPISFTVTLIPVLASGAFNPSKKQIITADTTIK